MNAGVPEFDGKAGGAIELCREPLIQEWVVVEGEGAMGVRGVIIEEAGEAGTEPLGSRATSDALPLPLFFERT